MTFTVSLLLALLAASAQPRAARAGVEIRLEAHDARAPDEPVRTGRLLTEWPRVRLDAPSAGAPRLTLLFESDDGGRLALVDHADRSVWRIDRAGLAALAERARAARAEWEARLERVSPEQRAVLERMAGHGLEPGAATPAPLRIEPASGRLLLGGVPARRHELWRGDRHVGELWLAAWRDVDVPRPELRAVRDLGVFARDLFAALGPASPLGRTPHPLDLFADLDGFPLRVVSLGEDGQEQVRTDFERVERHAIEPAAFRPPAGYAESEPTGAGGPGLTPAPDPPYRTLE